LLNRQTANIHNKFETLRLDLFGDATGKYKWLNAQYTERLDALHLNTENLSALCFAEPPRGRLRTGMY